MTNLIELNPIDPSMFQYPQSELCNIRDNVMAW